MSRIKCAFAAAVTASLVVPVAFAQHADDVFVGRSSADQLKIAGFPVNLSLVYLPPSDGILHGWADNNPGFDRVITDDPDRDLFRMRSGANVFLVIEAIDPAFRVIDGSFNVFDEPGEAARLGNENLHTHLIWHIDDRDADFDPAQCLWDATFFLHDDNGRHGDSASFTMSFTNVPLRDADGDFEPDGDVDLDDHRAAVVCLSGPAVRPAPDDPDVTTCETECVNAFDLDADRDVDLRDVAQMQNRFGS
ncbi:MAG: hypothetical protein FLDDKLPJ_02381 [Phycisphaerae bacterium]|nr:hypothetical protein [Phycisphaerae bacterium]